MGRPNLVNRMKFPEFSTPVGGGATDWKPMLNYGGAFLLFVLGVYMYNRYTAKKAAEKAAKEAAAAAAVAALEGQQQPEQYYDEHGILRDGRTGQPIGDSANLMTVGSSGMYDPMQTDQFLMGSRNPGMDGIQHYQEMPNGYNPNRDMYIPDNKPQFNILERNLQQAPYVSYQPDNLLVTPSNDGSSFAPAY